MKVLIFWDVYGRIWRNALLKELPALREKYSPDFVVTNVDNISSGRWAIEKHILELEEVYVDIMTAWDHIFDNFDKVKDYLSKNDSRLLRFANLYNAEIPWVWEKVFEKNGKKLLVIHLQWEIFMNHKVFSPFLKAK
jgi:calcineurin-like phosphoesterase